MPPDIPRKVTVKTQRQSIEDWEGFPARVRRARFLSGLKRTEIDSLTAGDDDGHVSARLVGDWERGTNAPRHGGAQLRAFAEIVRADLDYLIYGEEEEDD